MSDNCGRSSSTIKPALTVEIAEYAPRGGDRVMIWVNQRRTDLGGYSIESVPRHIAPKLVAAMQADAAPVATYRHKKRGTLYTVLGEGTLQCSANELSDNQPIVVYRGEDGKLWARGVAEFHDGRFEAVVAHETPETSGKLRDAVEVWRDAYDAITDYYCYETEKAAAAVIEQDRAELVAEIERLRKLLLNAADWLKDAPIESGICCCGDPIEVHSYYSGHSPVDAVQYSAMQLREEIRAALEGTSHD